MTIVLDGPRSKTLRHALISAFPSPEELERMFTDHFSMPLAAVTAPGDLEAVCFGLIKWAKARGRVPELISAARNANPGNESLYAFASSVGMSVDMSPLEAILPGHQIFLDVEKFRTDLAKAERRVCRIDFQNEGVGTGFLVGPDLVLTNHHVMAPLIHQPEHSELWSFRFDYKVSGSGATLASGMSVSLADSWLIDSQPHSVFDLQPDPKAGVPTDSELDFALIRLAQKVGAQDSGPTPRGWFTVSSAAHSTNTDLVAILQHPRAGPMKLSFGIGRRITRNQPGNRLRHGVSTDAGSSGSPVFDGDFRLIGLHHSGDPNNISPTFNEAIPIEKIASLARVRSARAFE